MNPPVHICILTSAHPRDDVRVNHKFAHTFVKEGFRVSWVGPNYTYVSREHAQFPGVESHLFAAGGGRLSRLVGCVSAYRQGSRVEKVDVYYAPDPDAAAAALRLARRCGARVIFDIHEAYHDIHMERWIRGRTGKAVRQLYLKALARICSQCDVVTGVSQAVLEPFRPVLRESMIVRSCAPLYFAEGSPPGDHHQRDLRFTFIHGKADLSHSTDVVLRALSIAKRRVSGLRCVMFDHFLPSVEGFGRDQLRESVSSLGIDDVVELRERTPMERMPEVIRRCDAGLIAIDRRRGRPCIPNRLFEYMAPGLPVIVPEYALEICNIVEAERCGLKADFEDPSSVAAAMVQLAENPCECKQMGGRAREAFIKRHNWEVEVQPLIHRIRSWFP